MDEQSHSYANAAAGSMPLIAFRAYLAVKHQAYWMIANNGLRRKVRPLANEGCCCLHEDFEQHLSKRDLYCTA